MAHERDVVERDRLLAVEPQLEPRQVHHLELAGVGAVQRGVELLALAGGEEADRSEVDAEHGDLRVGEAPQGMKDAAVTAQDQAEADVGRALLDALES